MDLPAGTDHHHHVKFGIITLDQIWCSTIEDVTHPAGPLMFTAELLGSQNLSNLERVYGSIPKSLLLEGVSAEVFNGGLLRRGHQGGLGGGL